MAMRCEARDQELEIKALSWGSSSEQASEDETDRSMIGSVKGVRAVQQ
ncbi:hypothetical protein FOPG_02139 [Fusarium oxysporum f. sp. conglutinans race 2 54008]|uniref:Uncharacterized protein n=1 Tax=Fusarium oxysporum f. sp. conglutinans race 2 54008 TaxID=1089457 RepID=X0ICU7_FUSOX|nr:hypothetical protein FOPG_02139 [Fusarium oxysporum f. sp. conglutinans race 2 54008]